MPVTDGERVNVFDRRILGDVDFDTRLLSFLETGQRRHLKAMLTGPLPTPDPGTWLAPVTVTDGAGVNDLTFGAMRGTDGDGELISVEAGDSRITDVPFEDAAVTYYLAQAVAEVPAGVQVDTETGVPNYDYDRKDIGHRAEPTAVVDGGGFLTVTIGNHALDGADDFTGRTAIVFLKTPVSLSAAVAIETVTVSGTTVTTTGTLGQSSPSTTASDYEVVLLGPTITRSSTVTALAGWAFIGTVVGGGAPRTFDTSSQPQIVTQAELSDLFENLLSKGFLSIPTVTVTGGGATINVTTTGTLFTVGRLLTTPSGASFTGLPATSDVYIAYNVIAGDFSEFASWDLANAGSNVPLYWAQTDGGGLVVESAVLGRRVEQFPESMLLTVSSSASHHAAFRDLEEALLAVRAIQQGATIPPQRTIVELAGDVTVAQAIGTNPEVFDVVDVTIRGTTGNATMSAGSRIRWSFNTAPLFDVPAGATMQRWHFEAVGFLYEGAAAAAITDSAVLYAPAGATVQHVRFDRCGVDGNSAGNLACFLYGNGSTILGLKVVDSDIVVKDHAFLFDAATLLVDTRLSDLNVNMTGVAPIFASQGVFTHTSTVALQFLRVRDCYWVAPDVTFTVERALHLWARGNSLISTSAGDRVVEFGNSAGASFQHAWFTDNSVRKIAGGGNTADLVRFRVGGSSTTDPLHIFCHDNSVRGDNLTSGTGIVFEAVAADAHGVVVHANGVADALGGYSYTGAFDHRTHLTFGNLAHTGTRGIVAGVTGSYDDCMIFGNLAVCEEDTAVMYEIGAAVDNGVVALNVAKVGNSSGGRVMDGMTIAAGCFDMVVLGNWLEGTGATGRSMSAAAQNSVYVGNNVQGGTLGFRLEAGAVSSALTGNVVQTDAFLVASNGAVAGNVMFSNVNLDSNNDGALTGNWFQDVVDVSSSTVLTGNRIRNLDFDTTPVPVEIVMTGNRIEDGTSSTVEVVRGVFTGNYWEDEPVFGGTSAEITFTGNHVDANATWSVDFDDGQVVGNYVDAGVTLAAGSTNIAAIGNRINGTLTDSGTGNLTQTATDGDPLNV